MFADLPFALRAILYALMCCWRPDVAEDIDLDFLPAPAPAGFDDDDDDVSPPHSIIVSSSSDHPFRPVTIRTTTKVVTRPGLWPLRASTILAYATRNFFLMASPPSNHSSYRGLSTSSPPDSVDILIAHHTYWGLSIMSSAIPVAGQHQHHRMTGVYLSPSSSAY